MVSIQEQIPKGTRLIRRPSRDEREDDLPELRTEDGRTIAVVEEIPTDYRH
jgi:hypothetical protein